MFLLAWPEAGHILPEAYDAFQRLLAVGNLFTGAAETALNAPASDRKIYLEFGPEEPPDLPEILIALRRELCALVWSKRNILQAELMPGGQSNIEDLIDQARGPILRVSSYPTNAKGVVNHPHTDIDLFTVLPFATRPGLEVWMENTWRSVEVGPTEALILPGDLLQHFGGPPPCQHRVTARGSERISASLFVNAEPKLRVGSGRLVSEVFAERLAAVRLGEALGGASHES